MLMPNPLLIFLTFRELALDKACHRGWLITSFRIRMDLYGLAVKLAFTAMTACVLRLGVVPGGCAGYSYTMDFSNEAENSKIIESNGVKIAISSDSLEKMKGTEIDFVITGSKMWVICSKGSVGPSDTVSPTKLFIPAIPIILPAGAKSTISRFAPL